MDISGSSSIQAQQGGYTQRRLALRTNSNRGRLQSEKTEKIEIQIWGTAKKYNSAVKKITNVYSSQVEGGNTGHFRSIHNIQVQTSITGITLHRSGRLLRTNLNRG